MSLGLRAAKTCGWVALATIVLLAMATGARAAGEWKIAEQTMTDLEAPEASIVGSASETFKLSVPWYASEIECSTLATEAPTKIFKGGTSEATLKLSSCQVLGPPFVAETCKVIEPIELKVEGELLLHSGKTYELFKAPTGKTSLGEIKFKEGAECPLPLGNELKGTLVGETEAGERKEQPLTFNSTIEALFGSDTLSFGTHPATLKGKSVWSLAAGYKGLKWAAVGEKTKAEKEEEEKLAEEAKLKEEKELEGPKWKLLLDSTQVSSLHLKLVSLEGYIKAENTLKLRCTGTFEKLILLELAESSKKAPWTVSPTTLSGCKWEGVSGCTINDGGVGLVKVREISGEMTMPKGKEEYFATATSGGEPFAVVYSEGEFCTVPEEEEITGTLSILIPEASTGSTTKLVKLQVGSLKLGNSKVAETAFEAHVSDFLNSTSTLAVHLQP